MKKFITLFFFGVLMSGCATITSGGSQVLTISSNAEGASIVLVDCTTKKETMIGKTPYVGPVKRIQNAKLVVKKDGFKTAEVALVTSFNFNTLMNIMSSGISGVSTDFLTGAIFKYAPESYMANLEPISTASAEIFQKQSKMRVFALFNYDRICGDIAFSKGEYLNSIYELYGAKNDAEKAEVLSFVRNVQANADSIPVFANTLAARM